MTARRRYVSCVLVSSQNSHLIHTPAPSISDSVYFDLTMKVAWRGLLSYMLDHIVRNSVPIFNVCERRLVTRILVDHLYCACVGVGG